jgi:trans-aconitate methyltransferase
MKSRLTRLWEAIDYRFLRGPRGGGKPVPAEALDHEYRSGAWDHFWGEEERARHEVLLGIITGLPGALSVLDLGCGSGRLASMLPPERIEAYLGVDLSNEGLERARALGLPFARFLNASYESWTPDRCWRVIAFNESLGYARDPETTARRFAGHVGPDGLLIVSHFRWGNHAAFWKRLGRSFDFLTEAAVDGPQGKIWDVRTLRLRRP